MKTYCINEDSVLRVPYDLEIKELKDGSLKIIDSDSKNAYIKKLQDSNRERCFRIESQIDAELLWVLEEAVYNNIRAAAGNTFLVAPVIRASLVEVGLVIAEREGVGEGDMKDLLSAEFFYDFQKENKINYNEKSTRDIVHEYLWPFVDKVLAFCKSA